MDRHGRHAGICKFGGGVVHRHDRVRDWLAKWISDVMGKDVLTEQFVPRWDRPGANGEVRRARLDVAFDDAHARRVYLDVAVVDPATADQHELRQRAARDGAAAAREEDNKRVRYPGPDLTPFVVEALGRFGDSADAFLRAMVPKGDDRAQALRKARQSISVLIQLANAELILSAAATT